MISRFYSTIFVRPKAYARSNLPPGRIYFRQLKIYHCHDRNEVLDSYLINHLKWNELHTARLRPRTKFFTQGIITELFHGSLSMAPYNFVICIIRNYESVIRIVATCQIYYLFGVLRRTQWPKWHVIHVTIGVTCCAQRYRRKCTDILKFT